MRVFISWSGEPSLIVARALSDWLPYVIPAAHPWVSRDNISAGARWLKELGQVLAETGFGILCMTRDNCSSPWMLFEAGALSKAIDESLVCPFLINLEAADLPDGPLIQFQAKQADETGTFELVKSLNTAVGDGAISSERLRTAFNKWWPDLAEPLRETLGRLDYEAKQSPPKPRQPADLSNADAILTCERYSTLVARYIVVEYLLHHREGSSSIPGVFSVARKRVYGLEQVLGDSTIHGGKFRLASVIGAAINNRQFNQELQGLVAPLLIVRTEDLLAPVDPRREDPRVNHRRETRMRISPAARLDDLHALEVALEVEAPMLESGLNVLVREIFNLIWRRCEYAINSPESVLMDAQLPP